MTADFRNQTYGAFVRSDCRKTLPPKIESRDSIKGETPLEFSDAALAAMNQTKTAATTFAEDADALKQNFLLRGFFFKQRGYEDPSPVNCST
jgi:hypothetical protein